MKSEFGKITLKQFRIFSEILSRSNLIETDYVRQRYLENALNFDETTDFLCELNLIQLTRNQIKPKTKYRKFLKKLISSVKSEQLITEFLTDYFINNRNHFTEFLNQFLANFDLLDGQYKYSATTSERLKYSGLRNFLMELGLVYYDYNEDVYIIDNDFLFTYLQIRSPRLISPEEFLQIQKEKADIGRKAELKAIEYEKQRLVKHPILVKQIEYVAQIDVTAGYDIKSFDIYSDENHVPRFIEVKAVSHWNYRFYWTRNEIETAKMYRNKYFLYLLPVNARKEINLESLKIIDDPYMKVYKNRDEWLRKDDTISFSLRKSGV